MPESVHAANRSVRTLAYVRWGIDFTELQEKDRCTSFRRRKHDMTTLLIVLIVWVVLSIPVALLLARMFRSTGEDARGRGQTHNRHRQGHARSPEEPELSRGSSSGYGAGEGDTHRVFPPR
ncbi:MULTISPECIES: hypothetical protein [unclassified Nocardia]|uniref:hypothetical protein n=1 Tax=unclassified Nocardia TaxID=2637762 RepID=UPI0035D79932